MRRYHDISHVHDPMAKRSNKVDRGACMGDGDIWVEKMCQSTKTGKLANYFVSTNTGKKVKDEPPTGASSVVFLKNEIVQRLYLANEHH